MKQEYERWRALATWDPDLVLELSEMENDPAKIEDSFFKALEFGTGGLRGVLGAGTNRMNIYTVARATAGLAAYLNESVNGGKSVAIGYDTRLKSRLFAETAARTLAAYGIQVHMFGAPFPTPMLSYAVRELNCVGGIMITASHNPAIYNGYKVYGADGCQITDHATGEILGHIRSMDYFESFPSVSFDVYAAAGKITYISEDLYARYIRTVSELSLLYGDDADKNISIVYTPLNGTGYEPVMMILRENGYQNVIAVEEQAAPDGNFPTCPYPNPEIPEALSLGLREQEKRHADLLIATDPDCDRVGVSINDNGIYKLLNGNEVGILLLDYVISQKKRHGKMPSAPMALKTIVTTGLAGRIAEDSGITITDVLTGFKYIGERIGALESDGKLERFLFGFEESCGYLSGTHARDKDGVNAAFLVAEMCAFYNARGTTLAERLNFLYQKHGYVKNSLYSYELNGMDGLAKMQRIMSALRSGTDAFAGISVEKTEDYKNGIDDLPKSDVMRFFLSNGSTVVVRPSGTEPKIKIYVEVYGENAEHAQALTDRIRKGFESTYL